MVNVYKGKLDIKSTSNRFAPTFVQYDHARLEIELMDSGEPYDLSAAVRVEFTHVRKDGLVIIQPGEIVPHNDTFLLCYEYKGSEMDLIGRIKSSIAIFDADDKKVSTHVFEVTVTEDLRNEVFNPAEPNIGVLDELLSVVQELRENGGTGMKGDPGERGLPGADGKTWHVTATTPANTLGSVGDMHLNTATYDVREKTAASTWTSRGNIKGAKGDTGDAGVGLKGDPGDRGLPGTNGLPGTDGLPGADGKTWHVTATTPTNSLGAVGDMHLNTATYDIREKTAASTWTSRGNIKGPKGDPGPKGNPGSGGVGGATLVVSAQKFNINTVTENTRIIAATGVLESASNYVTTDFIRLDDNTTEIICAKAMNISGTINFHDIVFFDENKTMVSGFNTTTITDGYAGRKFIPVPAGVRYFRMAINQTYTRAGIFFNEYSNNFNYHMYQEMDGDIKSKWFGKKVVAYGDSLLAAGSNTTIPSSSFSLVAKSLGINPINRAIGGSWVTLSNTGTAYVATGLNPAQGEYGEYMARPPATQPNNSVEIRITMSHDERVNTIPEDADAILILAGTNGMDNDSYRLMLQKIYARCPKAIVFCCSLPFRFVDTSKAQVRDLTAENTIIRNACQEYGAVFIDLKAGENVNQYNHNLYLTDDVHPTALGRERRAKIIVNHFKLHEPLEY